MCSINDVSSREEVLNVVCQKCKYNIWTGQKIAKQLWWLILLSSIDIIFVALLHGCNNILCINTQKTPSVFPRVGSYEFCVTIRMWHKILRVFQTSETDNLARRANWGAPAGFINMRDNLEIASRVEFAQSRALNLDSLNPSRERLPVSIR